MNFSGTQTAYASNDFAELKEVIGDLGDAMASGHEVILDSGSEERKHYSHTIIKFICCGLAIVMVSMVAIFTMMQYHHTMLVVNQVIQTRQEINTQYQIIDSRLDRIESKLDRRTPDQNVGVDFITNTIPEVIEPAITIQVVELSTQVQTMADEIPPAPEYCPEDLTTPSGFSPEQFNLIINETFATKIHKDPGIFNGLGETLYQIEQDNGFNALYILGIGGLESGYGTSGLAQKCNNPYGMIGLSFDSIPEATTYLGNLLQKNYICKGRTTLVKIGQKYCPPTYDHWAGSVQWITNQYIETAETLISEGRI